MFKKIKVVMLPTKHKATDKPFSVGITLCNDGKLRIGNPVGKLESREELYFLSDEQPKEGDWCYHKASNEIIEYPVGGFPKDHSMKVIGTTDELIIEIPNGTFSEKHTLHTNLPEPTESFIQKYVEEYNKGNIITDVMIEFENNFNDNDRLEDCEWVKVNKHNKFTTKKVKDSWNREEVIEIVREYSSYKTREFTSNDLKWIKDKL